MIKLTPILFVLVCLFSSPVAAQTAGERETAGFSQQVDLSALDEVAVQSRGRVKSFYSFASSMMKFVSGPKEINGQSPTFTYLDLMLRPDRYSDIQLIYVKKEPMRAQIIQTLLDSSATDEVAGLQERLNAFLETGLISERMLQRQEVTALLQRLSTDLIRTAKYVEQIDQALNVKQPRVLLQSLRMIPPAGSDGDQQWISFDQLLGRPQQAASLPITEQTRERALDLWEQLVNGWLTEDAATVNSAADQLAAFLPQINPEIYPAKNRLAWESFYFRSYNLTWIWVFYALALVPLLLSVVFRWRAAHWAGLVMFLLAFALHTFALGLRWYVAGRWPNTNMFEAVTTSAWFGGCAAILLEIIAGRTRMRDIFVLGSAVASMVALMCAFYQPVYLDAGIENRMPVLHDLWLYIHTNVIIFSYCLIFMAAVTASLYLGYRLVKLLSGDSGRDDFARVGGAGSLLATSPSGESYLQRAKSTFGQVIDGTTMILIELSFVMLWAGLVMGAIWADHSWGRPWGWDPKEVFALNTFIVFAVLIHVRLKAVDKGLWTALIALAGAGVMLFNWIAINFIITGLHSYA